MKLLLTVRSIVDLHAASSRSLLQQQEDAQRVDAVFGQDATVAMDAIKNVS